MICQWLEKVLHPYIKSECEKMLNELKKGKQFYQLRVVSD